MIVIDNFVSEEYILKEFTKKSTWNTLKNSSYQEWNGMDYIENTILGDFIWKVKNKFWEEYTWSHFEYWDNQITEQKELKWHVDRNEAKYRETAEVLLPLAGAVWYGYPHDVWGGYLEIQNESKYPTDIERIQPVYNRLVVFDVSKLHRVSPVFKGTRYGLQINLW